MRWLVHFHATLNAWAVDANLVRTGGLRWPDLYETRGLMAADGVTKVLVLEMDYLVQRHRHSR